MFNYPVERTNPVNTDKLTDDLKTAVDVTDGIRIQRVGEIIVRTFRELTAPEVAAVEAVVVNHDPADTVEQAEQLSGRDALAAFLDSHTGDLKYAKYLLELFASVLALWTTKPNLTERTAAVITALKADKDNNLNDLRMYRVFLDVAAVEYGLTVTNDEIVFSGTAPQQAAQARAVLECARSFMNTGVIIANMLLRNR